MPRRSKEKWENSVSKSLLRVGVLRREITEDTNPVWIHTNNAEHRKWPIEGFKRNLTTLLKGVKRERDRMQADTLAYGHDLAIVKSFRTESDVAAWHRSPAYKLLKQVTVKDEPSNVLETIALYESKTDQTNQQVESVKNEIQTINSNLDRRVYNTHTKLVEAEEKLLELIGQLKELEVQSKKGRVLVHELQHYKGYWSWCGNGKNETTDDNKTAGSPWASVHTKSYVRVVSPTNVTSLVPTHAHTHHPPRVDERGGKRKADHFEEADMDKCVSKRQNASNDMDVAGIEEDKDVTGVEDDMEVAGIVEDKDVTGVEDDMNVAGNPKPKWPEGGFKHYGPIMRIVGNDGYYH